jgi:hypothetical protein
VGITSSQLHKFYFYIYQFISEINQIRGVLEVFIRTPWIFGVISC